MTVQCGDVDIDANTNYVEEVWGNIHHEPLDNVREISVRSVLGGDRDIMLFTSCSWATASCHGRDLGCGGKSFEIRLEPAANLISTAMNSDGSD